MQLLDEILIKPISEWPPFSKKDLEMLSVSAAICLHLDLITSLGDILKS